MIPARSDDVTPSTCFWTALRGHGTVFTHWHCQVELIGVLAAGLRGRAPWIRVQPAAGQGMCRVGSWLQDLPSPAGLARPWLVDTGPDSRSGPPGTYLESIGHWAVIDEGLETRGAFRPQPGSLWAQLARDRLAPLPGLLSPLVKEGQAGDRVHSDLGHIGHGLWRPPLPDAASVRQQRFSRKKKNMLWSKKVDVPE